MFPRRIKQTILTMVKKINSQYYNTECKGTFPVTTENLNRHWCNTNVRKINPQKYNPLLKK